jgi:hypothetical protein
MAQSYAAQMVQQAAKVNLACVGNFDGLCALLGFPDFQEHRCFFFSISVHLDWACVLYSWVDCIHSDLAS